MGNQNQRDVSDFTSEPERDPSPARTACKTSFGRLRRREKQKRERKADSERAP